MHIQPDRATNPLGQAHHSHLHDSQHTVRENQRDNDTDRHELTAQSRQVARAAERTARARSPSIKTAYPSAFSQSGPCPGSTEATANTGQTSTRSFMPRPAALIARCCFARSGAPSAAGRPATRRPSQATSATPGRFGSLAVAMRALRLDQRGRRPVSSPECRVQAKAQASRRAAFPGRSPPADADGAGRGAGGRPAGWLSRREARS